MYTSYYGFKEKPFQILPNQPHLFMSRGHGDTYAHLSYALMEDKGFVVVTGEAGSGKTSLVNFLVKEQGAPFNIGVMTPNGSHSEDVMTRICRLFGLRAKGDDTAGVLRALCNLLIDLRNAGHRAVLIVDEADHLTDRDLEQVRMLANLEVDKHYLVQIILVGRPDITQKIQETRMKYFVKRATVTCHLHGLDRDEMGSYINNHLRHAGGSENIGVFDQEATDSIFEHSRGIPKLTNIISDAALIYGYADELKVIGKKVVEEVVKDNSTEETIIGGMHRKGLSPATVEAEMTDWRMEKDIRWDIEKQVHVLENTIRRINQALHNRNSARINRGEIISELTPIIRRMENQLTLLLEDITILIS